MEDKRSKTLEDMAVGEDVLNRILVAQEIIPRVSKQDHIKLKSFCTATETLNSEETPYGMGNKFYQLLKQKTNV